MAHESGGVLSHRNVGDGVVVAPRAAWLGKTVRLARAKPLGAIGLVLVVVLLAIAVAAPVLARYDYAKISFGAALQGPSAEHWLGTDHLGRDLFTRVVYGARVSLLVGVGATVIAQAVGMLIGLVSGYAGGWVDALIQRFVDIWMSFPNVILIISVMSVVGIGKSQVIVVLGLLGAATTSRVVRSAVVATRARPFVEAAHTVGASTGRVILRHVFPNILPVAFTLATVQVGSFILAESTISFLGFGVPPPEPTWGQMFGGEGREYLVQHPIMAIWPGLAIAVAVFGFNMLGDALRDIGDPRLRGNR